MFWPVNRTSTQLPIYDISLKTRTFELNKPVQLPCTPSLPAVIQPIELRKYAPTRGLDFIWEMFYGASKQLSRKVANYSVHPYNGEFIQIFIGILICILYIYKAKVRARHTAIIWLAALKWLLYNTYNM